MQCQRNSAQNTKETLGEECGGLDWGKCLEIGTNSRRSSGIIYDWCVEDRYEVVRFNVIIVTSRWGVKLSGKKHYVTLNAP